MNPDELVADELLVKGKIKKRLQLATYCLTNNK